MASPAAAGPGAALPPGAAHRDLYWLRSFIAGGVAGCCAKTTTAPLDRVKILLQAHNHHYKHLGDGDYKIVTAESCKTHTCSLTDSSMMIVN